MNASSSLARKVATSTLVLSGAFGCGAFAALQDAPPRGRETTTDATTEDLQDPQDPKAPPKSPIEPPVDEVAPLPVPESAPAEIKALVVELAKEGATVDFEKKQIAVKGAILLDRMNPNYPIEYLLVTNSGFTHEAFAIVRVTPSKLNAALLALGLTPGKTVQYEKKVPAPPMEKLISGEESELSVIPPSGPVVDIAVKWTDETGERIHPIEDMVRYLTNGRPLPRRGFVYIGSRFSKLIIDGERQERYMADVEGNLVSLYLSGFGNCLFDMNSDEGVEPYLYDINAEVAPPRGTTVTFTFTMR
jgi:hypothetical protein